MKKIMIMMCAVVAGVATLRAGTMEALDYVFDISSTNIVSDVFVIRGTLEAVRVEAPAAATATCKVTVASDELTLFEKSSISTAVTYLPRAATHTTVGGLATFVAGDAETNTWYAAQPMAGPVKVTLEAGAAANEVWRVRLIYSR